MYSIKKYEKKYENDIINLVFNIITQEYQMSWNKEAFINDLKSDLSKLDGKGSVFLIAVDKNDKLIGVASLIENEEENANLKRMYVEKEYRRQGIAQEFLNKIIDIAHKNKYEKIYLGTYRQLESAIKFYSKNGFKIYKEINEKVYMELDVI